MSATIAENFLHTDTHPDWLTIATLAANFPFTDYSRVINFTVIGPTKQHSKEYVTGVFLWH